MKETDLPFSEDEINDSRRLTQQFQEEFRIFDEVFDLTLQYLSRAQIGLREADKLIATAILFRAIEAARAVRILSSIGLTADASACARILLEAMAKLGNAANDPGFIEKFDASALADRLKLHNGIRRRQEDQHLSNDDVFTALTQMVVDQGAKKMPSAEELLANLKLGSAYDFAYRFQSGDVHVTPDSLKRYFTMDAKRELVGLQQYPHDREVPTVIGAAAATLLASLDYWATLLGITVSESAALGDRMAALLEARRTAADV